MSFLPPAVHPLLEKQIDWDNDADRDLCEIADHVHNWDSNMASCLSLTKVDISDIKQKFMLKPELQRYVGSIEKMFYCSLNRETSHFFIRGTI